MSPEIQTNNGAFFNFHEPANFLFDVHTIASALSKICRFTGHCREFYSVAQHSVAVSRIVPEEYALAGLMHDAAEAFVGDVSAPLKQLLPDYQAIEKEVERALLDRFGIDGLPREVKQADLVMLATERRDLLLPRERGWNIVDGLVPLDGRIVPQSPDFAKREFLRRYHEITGDFVEWLD